MITNFELLSPIIEDVVTREKPATILEICGGDLSCAGFFADCQKRLDITGGRIDRLINKPCAHIDTDSIGTYDFIFVPELPDGMSHEEAVTFFVKLQSHVTKQILFITPEYLPDVTPPKRQFHPLTFKGLDFSYWMHNSPNGNWQFYSFYKKTDYEPMPIDNITDIEVKTDKKMRIAFIMPHQGLNGGLKALLYQMRRLHKRGHTVKAYFRSNTATRVIPSWSEIRDDEISEQIIVPEGAVYLDYIKDVDMIIVGWLELIPQFLGAGIPVVLWEQGYEYLYGDYNEQIDTSYSFRHFMAEIYRSQIHILSVSPFISDILRMRYNRKTSVFTPHVDTELYFPWQKNDELPPVLLVGHPYHRLKGFDVAFKVLRSAWDKGARFKVWWAFQEWPQGQDTPFEIDYYHMLNQESLALLYRFAYVFLFTSYYEAYSLPPLEAMASGTAVLAADNGGMRTYATHGENCLMREQGDIDGMAESLVSLINDPELRQKLGYAGRKTALNFSGDRVTDKIEKILRSIAFAAR